MMSLLLSLVLNNLPINFSSDEQVAIHPVDGLVNVGTHFVELRPDIQTFFNTKAKHWDGYDYKTNKLKHMFAYEMKSHPGYSYQITFSADWQIISIFNGWTHEETTL